jgi:hypothetical protein
MITDQQPSLVRHIDQKHRYAGRSMFEDVNSWVVLKKIFSDVLQDPRLRPTIFIIDALDECIFKLRDLLDFIVSISVQSSRIKWLFSSRDWPVIEEPMARAKHLLSLRLELNRETVADGVRNYSEQKVQELALKRGYPQTLQQDVLQYFEDNAGDTFLWVALVCKSLDVVIPRHVRRKLNDFPSGLDGLYARMMDQIENSSDRDDCQAVLATVTLACRPLTIRELRSVVSLSEDTPDDVETLEDIVRCSGCFLTVRNDSHEEKVVHFVHQSARDYIVAQGQQIIFPAGQAEEHAQLAYQCLQQLGKPNVLRKDLCKVGKPGTRRSGIDTTDIARYLGPDLTYSCSYWIEHFIQGQQMLSDNGSAHKFLQRHFLHWLEALGWIGHLSNVIGQIMQLKEHLEV